MRSKNLKWNIILLSKLRAIGMRHIQNFPMNIYCASKGMKPGRNMEEYFLSIARQQMTGANSAVSLNGRQD